jgi:hypothetical protein
MGCVVGEADTAAITADASHCSAYPPGTYTPYSAPGTYPRGAVATLPWRGPDATYPNGDENFSAYSPGELVGCSDDKSLRTYLNVTDGCLYAQTAAGAMGGKVDATSEGYYRAVALGFLPNDYDHPARWTDQAVSYRFRYSAQTGNVGNPGFKAFARYRTEEDLYVGSWRTDGVVQIQRKQCGDYTPLVIDFNHAAPSPDVWHTIELDAVGTQLSLYLDGQLAVQATDRAFSSGTAGMRIDSMNGAAIAEWRVFAP